MFPWVEHFSRKVHGRSCAQGEQRRSTPDPGPAALARKSGRASARRSRDPRPGIALEQLEHRVLLAVVFWDGGPSGLGTNFHDPVNWVGDVLPGAADAAVIPDLPGAPTITITQNTTLNSLTSAEAITQSAGTQTLNGASEFDAVYTLSGGTLGGSGDLIFNGGLVWSGGTLGGSGLAVLPAGRVLSLTGSVTLAKSLDNFGTFNHMSAGTIALNQNAVLTNRPGGVFNHDGAGVIYGFGPWAYFVNEGVYNKNSGATTGFQHQLSLTNSATGVMNMNAGTFEWSNADQFGANFHNFGQIDIDAGAFCRFLRGATHNPGSSITGAGTVDFNYGPHVVPDTVLLSAVMTFTGGDVTLNQSRTFTHRVTLSGGSLAGSGNFTFEAGLNWSGGTLSGSGLATIPAGQTLTHSGSNGLSRSLDNFGSIDSSSGLLLLSAITFTIRPGATFNAGTNAGIRGLGGWNQFINHGIYNKNGGGSFGFTDQIILTNSASGVMNINVGTFEWVNSDQFGANFHNFGQIDIDAGAFCRFFRGATHNPGSSITGAGTVDFNYGPHVVPDTVLLSAVMTFTGGDVTLNQSRTFTHPVTLSNGSLNGSGTFTFAGGLNWSGGTHSGTGLTIIPSGQTLAGTTGLTLNRSLDNFGTVTLGPGSFGLALGVGAVFTNKPGAVFNHNSTGNIQGSGDSPVKYFINQGTYNKNTSGSYGHSGQLIWENAATGIINVNSGTLECTSDWSFINNGVIDLDVGTTLKFNRGTSHGPGSSIVGAGAVWFNGGTHTLTDQLQSTGALTFAGGTVTLNSSYVFSQPATLSGATLAGSGDLTFGGGLTWSGGTLTGSGRATNAPGQTVNRTGSDELSRHFDNFGTFYFTGTNSFNLSGAIVFTNKPGGVFNHVHAGNLRGLGASPHFINQGEYNKVTGGMFGLTDNLVFTNAAGGVLNVNAGTFSFQNSGGFSNSGTLNVLSGTAAVVSVSVPQISASTLTGGTWNVAGMLTFPSGTNLTTIGPGASVTLDGAAAAISKSGGGSAVSGLSTNNGTLTIANGAAWGFITTGTFHNNGVFTVGGSGAVTIPPTVTFNNGANLAAGGTLNIGDSLRGPGPNVTFGPFDGGGTINIRGTVAFNNDLIIFAIVNLFTTGTLTGTGNILIQGTFNWYGGVQTGTGSTRVGSGNTLNMLGEGVMTLARNMTNLVAGNWSGGCLLLDGGQFANAMGGTFTITGQVEVQSAGSGGEAFINEGQLVLAPGSDSSFGTSGAVTNTGTVVFQSRIEFLQDETLFGNVELVDGGEIAGPGTVTFAAGFYWSGGAMTGTGSTIIADTALLFMGDGNMFLSRPLHNLSLGGNWSGGCLYMSNGLFTNHENASLDIFAQPRIDIVNNGGDNLFVNDGLITIWTGEFVIGVPGINNGTIVVIPPDTLIFAAGWTYMPGSSLQGPGGVAFMGGMHSFPTGSFSITGPVSLLSGTLVLPGSSLPNYNLSTFTFTGGSWTIGDGAQLFINGADIRTIAADTTFTLSGGGSMNALANLANVIGTLNLENGASLGANPDGTSGNFSNTGHIRIGPGASLSITGTFAKGSTGVLDIGIAGTTNALMGRMIISGTAALGGSLILHYENGFIPSRGDSFRFIQSSGTTGAFASTSIPAPPASNLKSPVLTDAGGVRLIVTHIADFNNDLQVNVPDIFAFLSAWFAGNGDFNSDGVNSVPDIFAYLSAWFSAA